jgi:hypothetical protein
MWSQMGMSVRSQLGAMQTRTETSATYSTQPNANAPVGEYVVFEFRTSFANVPAATETLIGRLEADGMWRGVAYGIRPAQ